MEYKLEKTQIKLLKTVISESKKEDTPITEHTISWVKRILEAGKYGESDSGLLNLLNAWVKANKST